MHTAAAVRTAATDPGTGADAVTVDGGLIVAIGPYAELTAAHPAARVRRWPGLLLPGLLQPRAVELLEAAYHPDPREAGALGTEPLTGAALAALAPDEVRWGGSARRGLQRMLAHGTTAVTGPFTRPSVRTAVSRSGLRVRGPVPGHSHPGSGPGPGPGPGSGPGPSSGPGPGPAGAPSLDPAAGQPPGGALLDGELHPGGPADFAVLDLPAALLDALLAGEEPERALRRAGAAVCAATVLGGRLVHRRS
ncbi:hypothetical protein [Streptomyces sp. NPDC001985]|uniref:imidazolonepropionase-like domain-containing protein n=1 Tax=Streptomyces sp. NPDC001985 TaxID=3154406 RepID=UPI00332BFA5A